MAMLTTEPPGPPATLRPSWRYLLQKLLVNFHPLMREAICKACAPDLANWPSPAALATWSFKAGSNRLNRLGPRNMGAATRASSEACAHSGLLSRANPSHASRLRSRGANWLGPCADKQTSKSTRPHQ
eukprot:10080134-Lingulodinium_polyedra.AAC.1